MMDDSVNPNHIGGDSVASTRMTAQSTPPPSLAPKTAQRTSLGHRLQRALTGGPSRRFTGLHSPLGGIPSPALFLNRRLAFPILAILALLAASLLFLLPGGLLQAQDDSTIEYAEGGTGAVATFTAVDPEGESIVWSLAGDDMDDFDIDNGVLRFESSPDFETPRGGAADNSNTYEVTVQASDGGAGTTAMEEVTIEVTNVEEPGTVTLSTLQPQVGVQITATLDDPDNEAADTVSWQWYRGNSEIAGATNGGGTMMSSYTPADGDVGSVLRAKAMYDDGEDEDKTAQENSAHAVRQAPAVEHPSDIPRPGPRLWPTVQTEQTREVAENTPAGTNIGAPVVASDPDVLTYSLDAETGAASFSIDRATGQLSDEGAAEFRDGRPPRTTVTVTATDPFPAAAMSQVTIMVTDVNEAPSVTGRCLDRPR